MMQAAGNKPSAVLTQHGRMAAVAVRTLRSRHCVAASAAAAGTGFPYQLQSRRTHAASQLHTTWTLRHRQQHPQRQAHTHRVDALLTREKEAARAANAGADTGHPVVQLPPAAVHAVQQLIKVCAAPQETARSTALKQHVSDAADALLQAWAAQAATNGQATGDEHSRSPASPAVSPQSWLAVVRVLLAARVPVPLPLQVQILRDASPCTSAATQPELLARVTACVCTAASKPAETQPAGARHPLQHLVRERNHWVRDALWGLLPHLDRMNPVVVVELVVSLGVTAVRVPPRWWGALYGHTCAAERTLHDTGSELSSSNSNGSSSRTSSSSSGSDTAGPQTSRKAFTLHTLPPHVMQTLVFGVSRAVANGAPRPPDAWLQAAEARALELAGPQARGVQHLAVCAGVLVSLSHLGVAPSAEFLQAVADLSVRACRAGQLLPSGGAEVLWVFARVGWHPGPQWLEAAAGCLEGSNTAAAPRPPGGTAAAVGAESGGSTEGLGSRSRGMPVSGVKLVQAVWALAVLERDHSSSADATLDSSHNGTLQTSPSASKDDHGEDAAPAAARARDRWLAAALAALEPQLPSLSGDSLATLAWSLAQLKVALPAQLQPSIPEASGSATAGDGAACEGGEGAGPEPRVAVLGLSFLVQVLRCSATQARSRMSPHMAISLLSSLAALRLHVGMDAQLMSLSCDKQQAPTPAMTSGSTTRAAAARQDLPQGPLAAALCAAAERALQGAGRVSARDHAALAGSFAALGWCGARADNARWCATLLSAASPKLHTLNASNLSLLLHGIQHLVSITASPSSTQHASRTADSTGQQQQALPAAWATFVCALAAALPRHVSHRQPDTVAEASHSQPPSPSNDQLPFGALPHLVEAQPAAGTSAEQQLRSTSWLLAKAGRVLQLQRCMLRAPQGQPQGSDMLVLPKQQLQAQLQLGEQLLVPVEAQVMQLLTQAGMSWKDGRLGESTADAAVALLAAVSDLRASVHVVVATASAALRNQQQHAMHSTGRAQLQRPHPQAGASRGLQRPIPVRLQDTQRQGQQQQEAGATAGAPISLPGELRPSALLAQELCGAVHVGPQGPLSVQMQGLVPPPPPPLLKWLQQHAPAVQRSVASSAGPAVALQLLHAHAVMGVRPSNNLLLAMRDCLAPAAEATSSNGAKLAAHQQRAGCMSPGHWQQLLQALQHLSTQISRPAAAGNAAPAASSPGTSQEEEEVQQALRALVYASACGMAAAVQRTVSNPTLTTVRGVAAGLRQPQALSTAHVCSMLDELVPVLQAGPQPPQLLQLLRSLRGCPLLSRSRGQVSGHDDRDDWEPPETMQGARAAGVSPPAAHVTIALTRFQAVLWPAVGQVLGHMSQQQVAQLLHVLAQLHFSPPQALRPQLLAALSTQTSGAAQPSTELRSTSSSTWALDVQDAVHLLWALAVLRLGPCSPTWLQQLYDHVDSSMAAQPGGWNAAPVDQAVMLLWASSRLMAPGAPGSHSLQLTWLPGVSARLMAASHSVTGAQLVSCMHSAMVLLACWQEPGAAARRPLGALRTQLQAVLLQRLGSTDCTSSERCGAGESAAVVAATASASSLAAGPPLHLTFPQLVAACAAVLRQPARRPGTGGQRWPRGYLPPPLMAALLAGLAGGPPASQLVPCLRMLAVSEVRPHQPLRLALYSALMPLLGAPAQDTQLQGAMAAGTLHGAQGAHAASLCGLTPGQLVQVAWALASMGVVPPRQVVTELAAAMFASLPQQRGSDLGRMVWALPRLGAVLHRQKAAALLAHTERQVKAHALPPGALTNLVWGLARLSAAQEWRPGAPLLERLCAEIALHKEELGSQQVALVLWSLAKLGYRPAHHIIAALVERAEAGMSCASMHVLSTTVYALAGLGFRPPGPWLSSFFQATYAHLESCHHHSHRAAGVGGAPHKMGSQSEAKAIARMLYGLATLRATTPVQWTQLAVRAVQTQLPACTPHDLTLLAVGCALLGPQLSHGWLRAFGSAVASREAGSATADKGDLAWAWRRLKERLRVDAQAGVRSLRLRAPSVLRLRLRLPFALQRTAKQKPLQLPQQSRQQTSVNKKLAICS